ncbi:hypothetical protein CHISP_3766 [Chitinispirillum alkaliphilum]|nr:hypothetical protein CHISP_3766 [Chitinispirillum alkaliphilum]
MKIFGFENNILQLKSHVDCKGLHRSLTGSLIAWRNGCRTAWRRSTRPFLLPETEQTALRCVSCGRNAEMVGFDGLSFGEYCLGFFMIVY